MSCIDTPAGRITRAALEAAPGWGRLQTQEYVPDPAAISTIRAQAPGLQALVFVAIWCGDCQRELPRFFRIADQAGIAGENLTLIALDRTMRDAEGLAARWNVCCVPTFIFLRDARELGRVLERPSGTLEGDIARMLGGG